MQRGSSGMTTTSYGDNTIQLSMSEATGNWEGMSNSPELRSGKSTNSRKTTANTKRSVKKASPKEVQNVVMLLSRP